MAMVKKIIYLFKRLYWHFIASPEQEARHLGVVIGEKNHIATRNWSTEPYLIKIGSHCQITDNVHFYTHGGGQVVRHIDPSFDCFGRITIGDYVYVGSNSLIMPGVTLGNNTLVAAGSVVTKSQKNGGVVIAGNPAKVICSIDEYYEKNKKYNIATKGLNAAQKRELLMSIDESKLICK